MRREQFMLQTPEILLGSVLGFFELQKVLYNQNGASRRKWSFPPTIQSFIHCMETLRLILIIVWIWKSHPVWWRRPIWKPQVQDTNCGHLHHSCRAVEVGKAFDKYLQVKIEIKQQPRLTHGAWGGTCVKGETWVTTEAPRKKCLAAYIQPPCILQPHWMKLMCLATCIPTQYRGIQAHRGKCRQSPGSVLPWSTQNQSKGSGLEQKRLLRDMGIGVFLNHFSQHQIKFKFVVKIQKIL